MENKMSKPEVQKSNLKGELTFEDKVVQKIVGISLESIPGLLTIDGGFFSNLTDKIINNHDVTTGIDVEVGKKEVAVDLDIVAEYGTDISKIYEDIKLVIEKEVKHMTNLEVIEVNVNVVDIKTKEQHEEDSVTIQDKVSEATGEASEFISNQTNKLQKAANKGAEKVKESTEPRVE